MVITESISGIPVKAMCSACLDVMFYTGGALTTVEAHEHALKELFDHHFETIHLHQGSGR